MEDLEKGTLVIVKYIKEDEKGVRIRNVKTTVTGSFRGGSGRGRIYYTTKAFGGNMGFPRPMIKKQRDGRLVTSSGKTKRQKRGSVI